VKGAKHSKNQQETDLSRSKNEERLRFFQEQYFKTQYRIRKFERTLELLTDPSQGSTPSPLPKQSIPEILRQMESLMEQQKRWIHDILEVVEHLKSKPKSKT
jgi:hypothetical protein